MGKSEVGLPMFVPSTYEELFMLSIFSRKRKYNDLSWLQVDVHNHLLPRVDDGSASVSQSLELLAMLANQGIQQFIATPHIWDGMYPNNKASIQRSWEETLRDTDLPKNQLRYAAEYMVSEQLLEDLDNPLVPLLCLAGGYLLIEMPLTNESPLVQEVIQKLIDRGITPILAHPERYIYYQHAPSMLKAYKDRGCLLQINLLSCYGYYGPREKNVVKYLAGKGMIDLIGTNVHDQRHVKAIEHYVRKEDISTLFLEKLRNAEFLLEQGTARKYGN